MRPGKEEFHSTGEFAACELRLSINTDRAVQLDAIKKRGLLGFQGGGSEQPSARNVLSWAFASAA